MWIIVNYLTIFWFIQKPSSTIFPENFSILFVHLCLLCIYIYINLLFNQKTDKHPHIYMYIVLYFQLNAYFKRIAFVVLNKFLLFVVSWPLNSWRISSRVNLTLTLFLLRRCSGDKLRTLVTLAIDALWRTEIWTKLKVIYQILICSPRHIHFKKRIAFFLGELNRSNWENTARFLRESLHILVYSAAKNSFKTEARNKLV